MLGHEEDKIIRIIDYGISEFAVCFKSLDIRDLASCPSGKRTDGVFDPYHLKIDIVSTLFAEKVHLRTSALCKYLAGKSYGNRDKCCGQNNSTDGNNQHQPFAYG